MSETFPSDGVTPKTVICKTWEKYRDAVHSRAGTPMHPIFRGHGSIDWPLVAPNGRERYHDFYKFKARGVDTRQLGSVFAGKLEYFKQLATGLPGVDISTLEEVDIEALARHHGFCTNLLDWSESSYIAAFFAFTAALDRANDGRLLLGTLDRTAITVTTEPVCIWRLSTAGELWLPGEFEIFSSLSNVNYWQKAQLGCFTRLIHKDHLDVVSYLAERKLLVHITKFIIPGSETGKALSDLESMNITYGSLFPDLRGAAIQANIGGIMKIIGSGG